jgi:hypothetical protein
MRGEESEPTDTNQHEAGAERPEETATPVFMDDGSVLAPGTSSGSGFNGATGTGTATYPWWDLRRWI